MIGDILRVHRNNGDHYRFVHFIFERFKAGTKGAGVCGKQ